MPTVFINFRGRDQAGFAALLGRELTEEFGRDAAVLSSRSIRPGDDFVAEILRSVRSCRVLLAIIGPDWLNYGIVGGSSDADETVDWVHREIAEAFGHGVRVVPVLTEGAAMPAETALAKDIAALSRCQYLRLDHRNVDHDLARIVEELARVVHRARGRVLRRVGRP